MLETGYPKAEGFPSGKTLITVGGVKMKSSAICVALVLVAAVFPTVCPANLQSAQGSGFFPVKTPGDVLSPPTVVEIDTWSAGAHTVHCLITDGLRVEVTINNTTLAYDLKKQTQDALGTWSTQSQTSGNFSDTTATTFVWEGYRYYFGKDAGDTWSAAAAGTEPCIAFGFNGVDVLTGSFGRDFIFGQNGNDTLFGGGARC